MLAILFTLALCLPPLGLLTAARAWMRACERREQLTTVCFERITKRRK